jgi:glycosyltransferase involved in cell wall biosynthesis
MGGLRGSILLAFTALLIHPSTSQTDDGEAWLSQFAHLNASTPVGLSLRALHAQQHPPRSECRSRRLLLVQNPARHFEGLASSMNQVVVGLAQAAHGNRTLIWGLSLPYLFDRTRPLWEPAADGGDAGAARVSDAARGLPMDGCARWKGRGGGPHACFFLPLSSCSLADVSPAELAALRADALNDGARVKMMEARRGVAAYHVPAEGPMAEAALRAAGAAQPNVAWSAALAAYTFRLRPRVRAALEARREALWWGGGGEAGAAAAVTADGRSGGGGGAAAPARGAVWSVHVRHGDVRALAGTYRNRRVFTFEDFWLAALGAGARTRKGEGPSLLFFASDSTDGAAWAAELAASGRLAREWPRRLPPVPRLATPDPASRFLSPLGSHTSAADGACIGRVCALPPENVTELLRAAAKPDAVPAAVRLFTVFSDAVEDLFLLSSGDMLLAQCSSFFSTYAGMLLWARGGGFAPGGALFRCLDEADVRAGTLQSGFFPGVTPGTEDMPPRGGDGTSLRWERHTDCFVEGRRAAPSARIAYAPGAPVPTLPGAAFHAEATRWSRRADSGWGPIRPSECPILRPAFEAGEVEAAGGEGEGAEEWEAAFGGRGGAALRLAAANLRRGRRHRPDHSNQAFRCWKHAAEVLTGADAGAAEAESPAMYELMLRETEAAISGVQTEAMAPYALADVGERAVEALGEEAGAQFAGVAALPPPAWLAALHAAAARAGGAAPGPVPAPETLPDDPHLAYAPLQLGCRCPPRGSRKNSGAGGGDGLLVVGWSGDAVPHSYAIVGDGLRAGLRAALAARGGGAPAGGKPRRRWALDFVRAPYYNQSWGGEESPDGARESEGGVPVKLFAWREASTSVLVSPALLGGAFLPEALAARGRAPLRPGEAPAWAVAPPQPAASVGALPTCPDVLLRVHFPLDLSPHPCEGGRAVVVGTTEIGKAGDDAVFQAGGRGGRNPWAAVHSSVRIVPPSSWAATGFEAAGVPRRALRVLSHGFDGDVFKPASPAARAAARKALKWDADGCVVVASVGHMRWVKGVDALVRALVEVASALPGKRGGDRSGGPRCVRAVMKGVDGLWGSTAARVKGYLAAGGALSSGGRSLAAAAAAAVADGKLVWDFRGATLPRPQVARLLQAADVYASPYRAEGFNLPVLEAAACGLPLVVTAGGATDDFVDDSFALRVPAARAPAEAGAHDALAERGAHLEPDPDALVDALARAVRDAAWRARAGAAAAAAVRDKGLSWTHVAERLLTELEEERA